jgi:hypothetical protein
MEVYLATYNLWLITGAIGPVCIDCPIPVAAGASTAEETAAIHQWDTVDH